MITQIYLVFHFRGRKSKEKREGVFLISNFRRVLNLVCILLGISPASDCGFPTFRNTLSVPSSKASHPAYEDGTDRVFRNVGKPQSDAGEIPKRIHTRGSFIH